MSASQRQLVGFGLAAVAVAALVTLLTLGVLGSVARASRIERIEAETAWLAEQSRAPAAAADLQAFAENSSRSLGARVTLIAPDGRVIADSSRERVRLEAMDDHATRPEVAEARLRGTGQDRRTSSSTNVEYHYFARRVTGEGPVGFVRVAFPSRERPGIRPAHVALVAGLATGSALLLAVLGWAIVSRLTGQVERMTLELGRSMREGRGLAAPAQAGAVIAGLASAVGELQARLLGQIAGLQAERTVLASVVAGMHEGVLLVGPDRRVRLANAAVARILELSVEPEGLRLEAVVRHPAVIGGIDTALSRGEEVQGERVRLPDSERVFELRVTPLSEGGGQHAALVLFFDVTRIERLERVRRDFVADVSHELRTPLTSIKAAVENLTEGVEDAPTRQRFLEMIRRHADRMSALVEDLTDLSLIETGSITLQLETLDATRVVRDAFEQLQPLALSQQVELRLDLPEHFPLVADKLRLEQMLGNLLTNAIKFNRPGGRVTVRAEHEGRTLLLHVEDTGVGIPADSVDKVFQRFYRVSRSRSREVGGTGLGLSIVKHLMRLHGGRVRVASELGAGSRFTLEFPLDLTAAVPQPLAEAL